MTAAVEDPKDIVRRVALALPETTRRVLKGDEHFITSGYVFAYVLGDRLVAKLAPRDSRRLLEEGRVALFSGLRSSRYGDWVAADLASAPPDLLKNLIDLAYARVTESPLVHSS
jgi:hypothetical protein